MLQSTAERLGEIKAILDSPLTKKERKMAKKKLASKKAPSKKTSKKAATTNGGGAEAPAENLVTLKELCEEVGITPQAARRKLRASNLVKQGRWAWEADSDELEEAREVISSTPAAEEEEGDE